jgi:hypothetical protein
MRLTIVVLASMAVLGCGTSPRSAATASGSPSLSGATGAGASRPTQHSGCQRLSNDTLDLAGIDPTVPPETAAKILEWIEAHPEQARQLGGKLRHTLEERVNALREQLARLESATEARCQGKSFAGSISRSSEGTAILEGRLLLPSGLLPLAGARVVLELPSGGVVASVRANECGRFRFEGLARGPYRLRFSTKSFGGSHDLDLSASAEAVLEVALRVKTTDLRIAVIGGHYDAVEVILAALGIPFERFSSRCIGSADLSSYDIVFVNCRSAFHLDTKALARLRGYVSTGGSMYFSDLTLPYVEQAWPDRIEPAREEAPAQTRIARVVDAELRGFLGHHETVDIRFNLSGWRRPATVEPGARVLLSDAAGEHGPYMVLFDVEKGTVGFTSFHYAAQPLDDMVLSLVYFVTRL